MSFFLVFSHTFIPWFISICWFQNSPWYHVFIINWQVLRKGMEMLQNIQPVAFYSVMVYWTVSFRGSCLALQFPVLNVNQSGCKNMTFMKGKKSYSGNKILVLGSGGCTIASTWNFNLRVLRLSYWDDKLQDVLCLLLVDPDIKHCRKFPWTTTTRW